MFSKDMNYKEEIEKGIAVLAMEFLRNDKCRLCRYKKGSFGEFFWHLCSTHGIPEPEIREFMKKLK